MKIILEVITYDIYLVRSKSFEHSKTYSSYEEKNCDDHHDQGKHCLGIINTWKKTNKTLEQTKDVERLSSENQR